MLYCLKVVSKKGTIIDPFKVIVSLRIEKKYNLHTPFHSLTCASTSNLEHLDVSSDDEEGVVYVQCDECFTWHKLHDNARIPGSHEKWTCKLADSQCSFQCKLEDCLLCKRGVPPAISGLEDRYPPWYSQFHKPYEIYPNQWLRSSHCSQ